MRIDHSALYVEHLETEKAFFEKYFNAAAGQLYHNPKTGFRSYFLSFEEGSRLEIMTRDDLSVMEKPMFRSGFHHISFCVDSKEDVDVLTHEAGHAFQYYMSRNIPVMDVQWPTMESCEIHSMSMEFNAWPWMNLFFKEDEAKYKFLHLSSAVTFLPYGVLVDHFQHEVYNHPEMSPEERKACWRKLEKMYLPDTDYTGAPFLDKGTYWYRQGHIFGSPFYYIDYTLAQVCALQFWSRNYRKDPDSWKDYLHLCTLGGTKTFTGLVKEAGLKVPFEKGCLKETIRDINEYLESIDDRAL